MRRANPRPAAKRDEFPQGAEIVPALRDEVFGAVAPDGWVAVHEVAVAVDDVALLDEDGGVAVGAAAEGEGGVTEGDADHLDAVGVEAVGFRRLLP